MMHSMDFDGNYLVVEETSKPLNQDPVTVKLGELILEVSGVAAS